MAVRTAGLPVLLLALCLVCSVSAQTYDFDFDSWDFESDLPRAERDLYATLANSTSDCNNTQVAVTGLSLSTCTLQRWAENRCGLTAVLRYNTTFTTPNVTIANGDPAVSCGYQIIIGEGDYTSGSGSVINLESDPQTGAIDLSDVDIVCANPDNFNAACDNDALKITISPQNDNGARGTTVTLLDTTQLTTAPPVPSGTLITRIIAILAYGSGNIFNGSPVFVIGTTGTFTFAFGIGNGVVLVIEFRFIRINKRDVENTATVVKVTATTDANGNIVIPKNVVDQLPANQKITLKIVTVDGRLVNIESEMIVSPKATNVVSTFSRQVAGFPSNNFGLVGAGGVRSLANPPVTYKWTQGGNDIASGSANVELGVVTIGDLVDTAVTSGTSTFTFTLDGTNISIQILVDGSTNINTVSPVQTLSIAGRNTEIVEIENISQSKRSLEASGGQIVTYRVGNELGSFTAPPDMPVVTSSGACVRGQRQCFAMMLGAVKTGGSTLLPSGQPCPEAVIKSSGGSIQCDQTVKVCGTGLQRITCSCVGPNPNTVAKRDSEEATSMQVIFRNLPQGYEALTSAIYRTNCPATNELEVEAGAVAFNLNFGGLATVMV